MRLLFSKFRRARKTAPRSDCTRQSPGGLSIGGVEHGYNPYDTLPGVSRDRVGMRRRGDGKWTF